MDREKERIQACHERLLEADHHIESGHFRSSVESASGGVELLIQGLFHNLLMKLNEVDFKQKLALEAQYNQLKGRSNEKNNLTFCNWIDFYKNEDVFDELVANFSCQFFVFNADTLHTLRLIRNRCVHDNYRPSIEEALWVRNTVSVFLHETKNITGEIGDSFSSMHDIAKEWRLTWDLLISKWIEQNPGLQETELLSALLNQLMLITGLIADNRVSLELKLPLIWAVYYVIDPNDLIPEGRDSVEALIDDAAVITLTLYWLSHQMDNVPTIFRDHWPEDNDAVEFIADLRQLIIENSQAMFSDDIWLAIKDIEEYGPQDVWKHRHSSELPNKEDVDDAYRFFTEEPGQDNWYEKWRERVNDWIFENLNAELGEIVFVVPDLFMLVTRLLKDPRVSAMVKGRLAAATAYVVSPFDLIPEGLLGVVGLTDDAGALALIGYWLVHVINIDGDILREHWPGTSDPVAVIEGLHYRFQSHAETIFGGKLGIWRSLQQRFASDQSEGKVGLLERIRRRFSKGS